MNDAFYVNMYNFCNGLEGPGSLEKWHSKNKHYYVECLWRIN